MDIGFWIVIAYFVLSALGSILSRQAKSRAGQEAPKSRPAPIERAPSGEGPRAAGPHAEGARDRQMGEGSGDWGERRIGEDPVPVSRPGTTQAPAANRPQSAEDIAAEIRRVMGLERREAAVPEPRVEVIEETYHPDISDYVFDPDVRAGREPDHGGRLHDNMEQRGARGIAARQLKSSIGSGSVGSLASRYSDGVAKPKPRAIRIRHGSANVDLSNVARALVTAEILGPPKAYRGNEFGV